MSTATTLTNGSAPLPTLTELQAGAIAALDHPATRPQSADNGNLGSLWTLLNERVARAASPAPTAPLRKCRQPLLLPNLYRCPLLFPKPMAQPFRKPMSLPNPSWQLSPTQCRKTLVNTLQAAAPVEIIASANVAVEPQILAPVQAIETSALPGLPVATISEVLTPTIVTYAPEPQTITPLKELLTANARRKTVPPVRLETHCAATLLCCRRIHRANCFPVSHWNSRLRSAKPPRPLHVRVRATRKAICLLRWKSIETAAKAQPPESDCRLQQHHA